MYLIKHSNLLVEVVEEGFYLQRFSFKVRIGEACKLKSIELCIFLSQFLMHFVSLG